MEYNELQKIWRSADANIHQRSRDELNFLLTSKAKQAFNEFIIINLMAIPICIGVMLWLIVSTANRIEDKLYVANNILLGGIILFALFYLVSEWNRFTRNKKDKPVKEWIEIEINLLAKWLTGKYRNINFYLIPVLYVLTFLSIHIYYSDLYFTEVFQSDKFITEDMWGIIIFTPMLLAGLFISLKRLRKHQINKLEFLKDLQDRLANVD
ncbi:MAG: hypothetical protein ACNS62_08845 [Candidatus Cyclobacteriaceae bacterium M3_2C_046]